MQSMTKQFLEFCRSKGDEEFDPWSAHSCAGAQFLRAHGYQVRCCWVKAWDDVNRVPHDFPEHVGAAISWACDQADVFSGDTVPFSALASRLSNLIGEGGNG